ncbi:MAG: hypothetical protein MUD02_03820, partial [Bacteroidales bacterium]|nr:hypothetical protein [Bacteroidales bacterium]
MMDSRRIRIILSYLSVLLVLAAFAAELFFFSDFEYRFRTKRFNRILEEKERFLEQCLDNMKPILAAGDFQGPLAGSDLLRTAVAKGVTILEYLDDKLNYWSDNDFDVPRRFPDSLAQKPLVFLQNGWFITRTIHASNEKIVGLIRVHTDYEFENDIISDGFSRDFRIPGGTRLSLSEEASPYHVMSSGGQFLFSLVFPERKEATSFIILPLVLWSLVLAVLLILLFRISQFLYYQKEKAAFAALLSFYPALYILLLLGFRSRLLSLTGLFSPGVFSLNAFIPSLGHLLVLSILSAAMAYTLFSCLHPLERKAAGGPGAFVKILAFMLPGALLYSLITGVFTRLVSDANISFETYRILGINGYSIAAFSSVIMLMLVPVLYHIRLFAVFRQYSLPAIAAAILIALIVPLLVFYGEGASLAAVCVFYLLISSSLLISGRRKAGVFNLGVVFSVIFGLYSLYLIIVNSESKRNEKLKIQAVALSTENDPEAEQLILDLWPELNSDSTLAGMMDVEYFTTTEYEAVAGYLQKKYFTGYWRNFNLNIVLCRIDDPISIGGGRVASQNCFSFFEDRIRENGQQITGTEFYFLENQGGRSFYTGKVVIRNKSGISNGVFIELFSDVNVFQPGYSELLLEKNYHGYANLKDYSFAKYINGRAVLRAGTFPYDDTDAAYLVADTEFRFFRSEKEDHLV